MAKTNRKGNKGRTVEVTDLEYVVIVRSNKAWVSRYMPFVMSTDRPGEYISIYHDVNLYSYKPIWAEWI